VSSKGDGASERDTARSHMKLCWCNRGGARVSSLAEFAVINKWEGGGQVGTIVVQRCPLNRPRSSWPWRCSHTVRVRAVRHSSSMRAGKEATRARISAALSASMRDWAPHWRSSNAATGDTREPWAGAFWKIGGERRGTGAGSTEAEGRKRGGLGSCAGCAPLTRSSSHYQATLHRLRE